MILSDQTIRERGLIEPFFERTKHNGMSFGVGPASYDIRTLEGPIIKPGAFAIVSAMESVKLPNDIAALAVVKSTWMRKGLLVGNGYFDPGFEGHPTIMLVNHGPVEVLVRPFDPIAQLVFYKTDRPVEAAYAGKYQNQGSEPVAAILYDNDHLHSAYDMEEVYRGEE